MRGGLDKSISYGILIVEGEEVFRFVLHCGE